MANTNTFLTISQITYESAMILKNSLRMGSRCNRQYDSQFARVGAKAGQTISIRKPPRFVGRRGATASFEGITEQYVPLTLSMFGVDLNYTSFDLTLSMDNFRARYLEPAIATVANVVDADGLALYNQIPWMVGSPGTTPNQIFTYWDAGAILSEEAAPRGDMRTLLLNPKSMATIADQNRVLFNPQGTISEQYMTGLMSQSGGWQWYEDQNVTAHQVGPLGGTPLVNQGGQTGSALVTNGWTAAAGLRLRRGDVFTISNVFAVNPQRRQSTGRLRSFVVTADTFSDVGGNATIPIYPPIIPPNPDGSPTQFQTVTASPLAGASLTVNGSANVQSPQNIGFHRDAVTLAMVDLEIPPGVPPGNIERVSDPDSNISIRFIQYYDGTNDISGGRLDVLYGWVPIYPELMVRIAA
jgi:P22 coat protein - gene protein 5